VFGSLATGFASIALYGEFRHTTTMASTASSDSETDMYTTPQAPQKYANEIVWYTFYSETEKRDYCYEPSTRKVKWVRPGSSARKTDQREEKKTKASARLTPATRTTEESATKTSTWAKPKPAAIVQHEQHGNRASQREANKANDSVQITPVIETRDESVTKTVTWVGLKPAAIVQHQQQHKTKADEREENETARLTREIRTTEEPASTKKKVKWVDPKPAAIVQYHQHQPPVATTFDKSSVRTTKLQRDESITEDAIRLVTQQATRRTQDSCVLDIWIVWYRQLILILTSAQVATAMLLLNILLTFLVVLTLYR
jgi:hypothetical protein